MNHQFRLAMLPAVLAAALAACGGDETQIDERIVDGSTPVPPSGEIVTVFEPLSREYTLTSEQQSRRDELNMEEFQSEYGRQREAIVAVGDPSKAGTASPDTSVSSAGGLRPRGQMDFGYLDRDGDGRLSVAEYAIWAVPIDTGNNQRPYLTSEQARRAADSFFYYDADGDTFLQPGEFEVVRGGGEPG